MLSACENRRARAKWKKPDGESANPALRTHRVVPGVTDGETLRGDDIRRSREVPHEEGTDSEGGGDGVRPATGRARLSRTASKLTVTGSELNHGVVIVSMQKIRRRSGSNATKA